MSEENPFASLDLANIPDNPFDPPVGTNVYRFAEFTVQPSTKYDGERSFIFKFVLKANPVQNWSLWATDPKSTDDEARASRGGTNIAKALRGLGVSEANFKTTNPQTLIGTEVAITLVKNGDYFNERGLKPWYGEDTPVRASTPAASSAAPDLSGLAEFASGNKL